MEVELCVIAGGEGLKKGGGAGGGLDQRERSEKQKRRTKRSRSERWREKRPVHYISSSCYKFDPSYPNFCFAVSGYFLDSIQFTRPNFTSNFIFDRSIFLPYHNCVFLP